MENIVKRLRDPLEYDVFTSRDDAADEIERLREALQSIANNTCCDGCQEAALVARKALGGE